MAIELKITLTQHLKQVATDAGRTILLGIARDIVRIARASTTKAKGPSAPNTPPHEHFGDLDRSIDVAVDGENVVVGPRGSVVGVRGSVLEFAGTFDPDAGRDEFGQFVTGHASRIAPSGAKWAHPFIRPAFEEAVAAGSFENGNQLNSNFT